MRLLVSAYMIPASAVTNSLPCQLGHRSLWDAGVVHRDISVNNILYRKPNDAESTLRGVLIDLVLAVKLFRDDSNAGVDFRTVSCLITLHLRCHLIITYRGLAHSSPAVCF